MISFLLNGGRARGGPSARTAAVGAALLATVALPPAAEASPTLIGARHSFDFDVGVIAGADTPNRIFVAYDPNSCSGDCPKYSYFVHDSAGIVAEPNTYDGHCEIQHGPNKVECPDPLALDGPGYGLSFQVRLGDRDDYFSPFSGVAFPGLEVRGGSGDDEIFGTRLKPPGAVDIGTGEFEPGRWGEELLSGGGGDDTVFGDRGPDLLYGKKGRDLLISVDRFKDLVLCGRGRDRAAVDRRDRIFGCERVRRRKPDPGD